MLSVVSGPGSLKNEANEMDWIGCILKLFSWSLVAKQNRWGFVFGVVGNAAFAYAAYESGLLGVVVYCFILTGIMFQGWFSWGQE